MQRSKTIPNARTFRHPHDPSLLLRILLMAGAVFLAIAASALLIAATNASSKPNFPSDPGKLSRLAAPPPTHRSFAWLRADIQVNDALWAAIEAISAGLEDGKNATAQSVVKQALSGAPTSGKLWLCLAALQQIAHSDALAIESLKMAYLVAPNDAELMPARLDTATLYDLLDDQDLQTLVLGDVRQLLRAANLRPSLLVVYKRASAKGRTFLRKAVAEIEPGLLPSLRG